MRAVIQEDWLGATDEENFRAGIGGVLLDVGADGEDGLRLIDSLNSLTKVVAILNAMQAGLSVNIPGPNESEKPLPLMMWWHEVKTV